MGGVCIFLEIDRAFRVRLSKTTRRDRCRVCAKFESSRRFRGSNMNHKKSLVDADASPSIQASIHRFLVSPTALDRWTPKSTQVEPTKYVYIKSTTVHDPSSELGLAQPLSANECAPTPQNRGGGAHSPAGEGLGESQFRRLEKKLSTLPTLWWTRIIRQQKIEYKNPSFLRS